MRTLATLAVASVVCSCAGFQPRGEFWTSDRWGKCAALVIAVGSVDLSAHACARVNNPSPDAGTADASD